MRPIVGSRALSSADEGPTPHRGDPAWSRAGSARGAHLGLVRHLPRCRTARWRGSHPARPHGERPRTRETALATMDGLLLPGGADLDPALYGEDPHPAVAVEAARDDLELAAWTAARERGVPIFGVCRGFQAINVFSGGKLVQHLEGHDSPTTAPGAHPLHLDPASRLAAILGETEPMLRTEVNSYHHQAVRPDDLAPGLVASALSPHEERRAGRGAGGGRPRRLAGRGPVPSRSARSSSARSSIACGAPSWTPRASGQVDEDVLDLGVELERVHPQLASDAATSCSRRTAPRCGRCCCELTDSTPALTPLATRSALPMSRLQIEPESPYGCRSPAGSPPPRR